MCMKGVGRRGLTCLDCMLVEWCGKARPDLPSTKFEPQSWARVPIITANVDRRPLQMSLGDGGAWSACKMIFGRSSPDGVVSRGCGSLAPARLAEGSLSAELGRSGATPKRRADGSSVLPSFRRPSLNLDLPVLGDEFR